jgi:hypothetical protein
LNKFMTRDRLLRHQFGRLAGGYSEAEDWENAERTGNSTRHPVAISTWLRAQNLFTSALYSPTPSVRYSSGASDARSAQHKGFWLRYSLLTLSGRASKPTLDLILASYYTEAWALERSMLEGWLKSIYVRWKPEEYRRWHEPYVENLTGPAPKRETRWNDAKEALLGRCDPNNPMLVEDQGLIREAQLRWEFLNMGAHPSGRGVDQMRNDGLGLMKFYPEYDAHYCEQALCIGVFIQSLLLREVKELKAFPDGWLQHYDEFMNLAEELAASVQPDLEKHSKALAAESAEKRNRKQEQARECRGGASN